MRLWHAHAHARTHAHTHAAEAEFSSHLAHEVRNPLSGIDNCSIFLIEALNTLAKSHTLNDCMMKDLSQIRSCVLYIQGILNNTLDLSKLEAGKLELKTSDLELKKDVIDIAISMLGRNKRSVEVSWCVRGCLGVGVMRLKVSEMPDEWVG